MTSSTSRNSCVRPTPTKNSTATCSAGCTSSCRCTGARMLSRPSAPRKSSSGRKPVPMRPCWMGVTGCVRRRPMTCRAGRGLRRTALVRRRRAARWCCRSVRPVVPDRSIPRRGSVTSVGIRWTGRRPGQPCRHRCRQKRGFVAPTAMRSSRKATCSARSAA